MHLHKSIIRLPPDIMRIVGDYLVNSCRSHLIGELDALNPIYKFHSVAISADYIDIMDHPKIKQYMAIEAIVRRRIQFPALGICSLM
jgi:hypothetical protein